MKKGKKLLTALCILCAALMLSTVLVGCSAKLSADEPAPMDSAKIEDYNDGAQYGASYDRENGYVTDINETLTAGESTLPGAAVGEYVRKIVRNASLEIEADDAFACYDALIAKAKELGGYESSCTTNKNDSEYSSWININLVIKLPPEQLDAFVSAAPDFGGEVTYSNVSADEITEQYYDVVTRLESKQKALESYYSVLEKANTVTEILEVQSYINRLTEEIESLEGTLRYYDYMVDESTVSIRIHQYTEAPASEKEFEWDALTLESFGKLIKNGFLGVVNFLWSAIQWLVIVLLAGSPIIIPAVILIIVFSRKAKKRKAERAAKAAEDKANGVSAEDRKAPSYGVDKK